MPDIWMDVDAALSEVPVNLMPLIDDADFKSIEDAIAYNAAGMDLRWNFVTTGGAFTSTAVTPTTGGNYDWTHQGDGIYTIEIPASGGVSINNNTEGFGWFSGKATGVLPWRGPVIGFRAAALNALLIDDAYSAVRGLAGTNLDAAVSTRQVSIWAAVGSTVNLSGTTVKAVTDAVTLNAAGVRAAIGLGTANLDDQLSTIGTAVVVTIPAALTAALEALSLITGADGAILASEQDNYAPAKPADVAGALGDFFVSAAEFVNLIFDEPLAGHETAGTAGKALSDAGAAGDPWGTNLPGAYGAGTAGAILGGRLDAAVSTRSSHSAADVDIQLTDTHGAGSWETGAGSTGAGARTITITIDDGTDPVENARVRLSEGVSTYIGATDADGEVTFNVDDATYTVAVSKAGYTFAGASLVVIASTSKTYSMTAIVVPPPVTEERATGSIRVYDEEGEPEVGASVTVTIQQGPGTAGHGYDTTPWTEESDANGDVHFAGLVRGATYTIYRGTSSRRGKTFVVPDEDTFDIAELLGSP